MKPTSFCTIALAALAAPSHGMQVQSLVAHYPLDESSGTNASDASGNNSPGTYMPGTTPGLPGARPETGLSARFFEDQDGVVMIPGELNMSHLRNTLSVSAWIRPESYGLNDLMRIFGNDNGGWSVAISDEGLRFSLRYIQDHVIDYDVPLFEWTHVAFSFDSLNDVTFYVNGVAIGQRFGLFPAGAANPNWRIGSLNDFSDFFDGRIDDIQLYRGVLTDAEVNYLFSNPGQTIDPIVGTPFCFGNGLSTLCPCFNYDTSGAGGCTNSTGQGARLGSSGSASVTADDLQFSATNLPMQPALLFVGNNATNGGMGFAFGDGLRCAGGGIRRLGVTIPGSDGVAHWGPNLANQGSWGPGDLKRFQAWYRDPVGGPCSSTFNLSQGVQVTFQP